MELKIILEKIKPFVALGIFIILVISTANLIKYNNLQGEIAENCEWHDEDVRCFCEKGEVIRMENLVEEINNISIPWSEK